MSETSDTIIVKDEKGVVLSLKKRLLDLDKMHQINQQTDNSGGTSEKKDPIQSDLLKKDAQMKNSKTYTAEDVDRLRQKYGDLGSGKTSDPQSSVEMSPAAYYKELQDASERGAEVMKSLASVAHEIDTIWRVSRQTGKDPHKWIQDFMKRTASQRIGAQISTEITDLKSIVEKLASPPKLYEGSDNQLKKIVTSLVEYDVLLHQHMIADVGDQGRENLSRLQQLAATLTEEIKSLPAPPAK